MNKGQSTILLDERWKLEDFSILTKEYQQLYGFSMPYERSMRVNFLT